MIRTTKDLTQATAITHGGVFHSDEVMATVILSKILEDVTILRTFDIPKNLDPSIIVYDIGGGKYDHHQKGGNGQRENGIPYSSCGLIWKKIGLALIKKLEAPNPELVWSIIDRDLVQGIDAIDNGAKLKSDYSAKAMTVPRAISGFNPTWDSDEDFDEAFLRAISFAEMIFDNELKNAIAQAKAKVFVEDAINKSSDHVMVLNRFVPWQEFIFSSNNPQADDLWVVVYPARRGGYNWQLVPDSLGSFNSRRSILPSWKGLSGIKLQKVTGVADATFCHNAGFIGGAESLEGALALANKIVDEWEF